MYLILLATLCISFYASANAGKPTDIKQDFLITGEYNDCEGKYAANYTTVIKYELSEYFTPATFVELIRNNGNKKEVYPCQPLLASLYPKGAYGQYEGIVLVTGGSLQGKYIYEKTIGLDTSYLKKSSSVLGLSYIKSKSSVLLINDELDPEFLTSPDGAFEEFKYHSSTVCNGVQTTV